MLLCSGSPIRETLLGQHNHVGRGALGLLCEAGEGKQDESPSPFLGDQHAMNDMISVGARRGLAFRRGTILMSRSANAVGATTTVATV